MFRGNASLCGVASRGTGEKRIDEGEARIDVGAVTYAVGGKQERTHPPRPRLAELTCADEGDAVEEGGAGVLRRKPDRPPEGEARGGRDAAVVDRIGIAEAGPQRGVLLFGAGRQSPVRIRSTSWPTVGTKPFE